MHDWLWREVAAWISVDQLLRWGAQRELDSRGVVRTERPPPAGGGRRWRPGEHIYYWRGAFEGQLRGARCEITEVRRRRCANHHCRRLSSTELAVRPAWTRSSWHMLVDLTPCGCTPPPLRHIVSALP